MKKIMKKSFVSIMALCMMLAVLIPAQNVNALSKNQKAHKAYAKKMRQLIDANSYLNEIYYKYMDVTGDGVHEAILHYHSGAGGSSWDFVILHYKNGKISRIHTDYIYGLDKIVYYPKTKAIYTVGMGHGGENHRYVRLKKGKYKAIASKGRRSIAGGNWENGPWYYYNGSGKAISSGKYKSLTKGLAKGSKKTIRWTNLKEFR